MPFADLAAAQAAVDRWVNEYNITQPHQSLGMASPAERFSTTTAQAELLPLRLHRQASGQPHSSGPVEFERVIPPSGNLMVARRQFGLGPHRAGMTITFWAST